MALSVSELETLRDTLLRARYAGVMTVSTSGKSITYQSEADMGRAINDLERRIAAAQATGPTRQVRVSTSKGL